MFQFLFLFLSIFNSTNSTNEIIKNLADKSVQSDKAIVIYFSGSDWCAICHKFNNEVLSKPEIQDLLTKDFIFYNADFPHWKKQDKSQAEANEFLAERLNLEGVFPVLIIADGNWNIKEKIYRGNNVEQLSAKLNVYSKPRGQ